MADETQAEVTFAVHSAPEFSVISPISFSVQQRSPFSIPHSLSLTSINPMSHNPVSASSYPASLWLLFRDDGHFFTLASGRGELQAMGSKERFVE
jgi:hypothetical protein